MTSPFIDSFNRSIPSLGVKAPVRVATTANITLSGTQTIDGVALTVNDRVLVKDQTDASENGIYDVLATAWVRSTDFNDNRDFINGTLVYANSGTANAQKFFYISYIGELSIGTTEITFAVADINDVITAVANAEAAQAAAEAAQAAAEASAASINLPTISGGDSGKLIKVNVAEDGYEFISGVNTDEIADDAVTLSKMASGTEGNLIAYDASGDPAYVATGTSGQVLTSNGVGAAPTMQDATGVNTSVTTGQTITPGGLITITHGLGAEPDFVAIKLVCTTGEHGYSAGDKIIYYGGYSADTDCGCAPIVDSGNTTQIKFRYGSSASTFTIINKTTGARANLTNANWTATFIVGVY